MKTLTLIKKYSDCYPYTGHYFNRQKAQRYIFKINRLNKPVEASAYHQQIDGHDIKIAIELSSMFSCPVGCKFCASGSLGKSEVLTENEIVEQAVHIASTIKKNMPLHFCYQGIGEPSLIPGLIINVSKSLLKLYPTAKFKLSTMGANPNGIIELGFSDLPFESIQITLPHFSQLELKKMFAAWPAYSVVNVLKAVKVFHLLRPGVKVKFNYTCIKGFNDNKQTIKGVIELLKNNGITLTDNLELKISFLNPTDISCQNKLSSSGREKHYNLLKFVQNLGISNCYVFGAMKNIKVGCGQLIVANTKNQQV
jgi:adenine C2-methylase RlmN of 23S rRNA A2503 and tRNA A37